MSFLARCALAASMLPAACPEATAQDTIGEFLKGKKIVFTVACGRAGRGTVRWELDRNGDLAVYEHGQKTPKILKNGEAKDEYATHSASVHGGQLHYSQVFIKLERVRISDTLRINGNSCSVEHKVDCGEYCYAVDPTCKVDRCTVQSAGK